mmetsp:Transcript_89944/g.178740  ORF Transcript_89944/g.178740 Transcript_89944/m.178740 type:complete len:159 (+) Transcript_89944:54-530(+)
MSGEDPFAAAGLSTPAADPFAGVPPAPVDGSPIRIAGIPEMNALREWEDKHQRDLEEKEQQEQTAKKERQAAAGASLKEFYDERAEETKKRNSANRASQQDAEASLAKADEGLNPWELVAKLIDTRGVPADTSRDTSRMRDLLIELKTSPLAQKAGEF